MPVVHNAGRPVTLAWEQGYASAMADYADGVFRFEPYAAPDSDWQRGWNDAWSATMGATPQEQRAGNATDVGMR